MRTSRERGARSDLTPVVLRSGETDTLSPDGRVLACIDTAGTFRLLDVATGQTIFQKRRFAKKFVIWIDKPTDALDQFPRHEVGDLGSARIDFSPDGRFVIALPDDADGCPIAWDLHERKALEFTGPTKRLPGGLSSLSPVDQVLVSSATHRVPGRTFPPYRARGVPLRQDTLTAGPGPIPAPPLIATYRASILRPLDDRMIFTGGPAPSVPPDAAAEVVVRDPKVAAAAVEYRTGQMIFSRTSALDVFDDHYVAERANGEIGLYERGKAAAVAAVRLEGR